MLLSKDKQNLLKIVSFDFLVVCMQVTRFGIFEHFMGDDRTSKGMGV